MLLPIKYVLLSITQLYTNVITNEHCYYKNVILYNPTVLWKFRASSYYAPSGIKYL